MPDLVDPCELTPISIAKLLLYYNIKIYFILAAMQFQKWMLSYCLKIGNSFTKDLFKYFHALCKYFRFYSEMSLMLWTKD